MIFAYEEKSSLNPSRPRLKFQLIIAINIYTEYIYNYQHIYKICELSTHIQNMRTINIYTKYANYQHIYKICELLTCIQNMRTINIYTKYANYQHAHKICELTHILIRIARYSQIRIARYSHIRIARYSQIRISYIGSITTVP